LLGRDSFLLGDDSETQGQELAHEFQGGFAPEFRLARHCPPSTLAFKRRLAAGVLILVGAFFSAWMQRGRLEALFTR
jgi:hypothetical protein